MKKRKVIASGLMMTLLTGCQRKEAMSVGIIGGADGPTAIYLTTKFNWVPLISIIGIGIVLIVLLVTVIKRRGK